MEVSWYVITPRFKPDEETASRSQGIEIPVFKSMKGNAFGRPDFFVLLIDSVTGLQWPWLGQKSVTALVSFYHFFKLYSKKLHFLFSSLASATSSFVSLIFSYVTPLNTFL